jgi:hypothetical protein
LGHGAIARQYSDFLSPAFAIVVERIVLKTKSPGEGTRPTVAWKVSSPNILTVLLIVTASLAAPVSLNPRASVSPGEPLRRCDELRLQKVLGEVTAPSAA